MNEFEAFEQIDEDGLVKRSLNSKEYEYDQIEETPDIHNLVDSPDKLDET